MDNPCKAPLFEEEECNSRQCPTLSEWTEWSECSATCGGGFKKKTRECIDKANQFYNALENPCKTILEVIEECNPFKCPMWTEWGEWTQCSKTCGGGQRHKYRQCVDHTGSLADEANCPGENNEVDSCNQQTCPYWTDWSDWTQCSVSCGGGSKSRVRECIIDDEDKDKDNLCIGDSIETVECNTSKCPVWTDWTDWTQCSASCGGGVQKRIRDCILSKDSSGSNDYGCIGDTWEMRPCNENDCPVWTIWTDWSPCTRTCGGGKKVKTRKCVLPESLGKERLRLFCPGDEEVIEDCNTKQCPIPGPWSEWSECSKSCGGGTRTKTRDCVNQRDPDGNPCYQDLIESEPCNENPCPVWTEWTDWTPCTVSCGGGSRKKARECVLPKSEQFKCTGKSEIIEECSTNVCPTLTPWTEWSECSVSCGGGIQQRLRECLLPRNALGENPCKETLEESRACNEDLCPKWTEWTEWSDCTASCDGGTKSRIRECTIARNVNFRPSDCGPGERNETVSCNENPCPSWTPWTEWSECSASCGGGTQHRARECTTPTLNRNGELSCDGSAFEDRKCNQAKCPLWTEWGPWSECTKSCGGGTRMKSRSCPYKPFQRSSPCGDGQSEVTETCNEDPCQPDPAWTEWNEWSSCSQTCGGGTKNRARSCKVPSSFRRARNLDLQEDKPCPGPSTMVLFCNLEDCPPETQWGPWGPWSQCTKNCGGGKRKRKRKCNVIERYGQATTCPGDDFEEGICNEGPCIQWTEWGPWSSCSATCGQGVKQRYRKCKNLEVDKIYNSPQTKSGLLLSLCAGPGTEEIKCDAGACGSSDCSKLGLPNKFYSFSGRPATSIGKKILITFMKLKTSKKDKKTWVLNFKRKY